MNLFLLFPVLFILSSEWTKKVSEKIRVSPYSDRMVFIEEGIVVYEASISNTLSDYANVGKNFRYVLLLAVAFGCCICCFP